MQTYYADIRKLAWRHVEDRRHASSNSGRVRTVDLWVAGNLEIKLGDDEL